MHLMRLVCGISFFLFYYLFPRFIYAQNADNALFLYREGRYEEAVSVCFREIKQKPESLESYVVLSWALLADQHYQEAAQWAEKGRAVSQYDPRLVETRARALYQLGKNVESLRLFETYIAYAPNGREVSEAYYHMGELYLRMAQYCHADIAFSTAVRLEPLKSLWWTRLAYAREKAREYRSALEAYARALKLNKNSTDAQKGYERVRNLL